MKILFYPQGGIHGDGYKIGDMIKCLDWSYTYDHCDEWDIALFWQFAGRHAKSTRLTEFKKNGKRVINENCHDLSKANLEKIHVEIFGYGTFAENQRFCMRKKDHQGAHDGIIIRNNKPDEGYIHQKIIDTRSDFKYEGVYLLHDIRVPIFGNEIPFLIIKYKIPEFIVADNCVVCTMVEVMDWFNDNEVSQIKAFAKKICLDYGELDILRDNCDGRIYITDAGKTPGNSLFKKIKNPEKVIKRYANSLKDMLCTKQC